MFSGFMQDAWLTGTLVALVAGALGFFVILRSSAFAAHAIPNGAFAGAAGANLLGVNPLLGLFAFSVVAAALIGGLRRRERSDVATALTLVFLLALGAAFLAWSSQFQSQVNALLFGEILGVSRAQLVPVAITVALVLTALGVMARPLLLSSVAPDVAEARGVRLGALDVAFLLLLAAVTAVTVPVVGALLTFALLVGPPAAARCLVAAPGRALIWSTTLALLTVWGSIASAYQWNYPIGFFVGSYGAGLYFVARLIAWRRERSSEKRRRSRRYDVTALSSARNSSASC